MKHDSDSKFTHAMRPLIATLVGRIGDDGHTIWQPDILAAFPAALARRHVRYYASDGSPKGSISTRDGQLAKGLRGVYGLHLLGAICADLGLKADGSLGRGTQARHYTAAIRAWLAIPAAPDDAPAVLLLCDGEKRPVAPTNGKSFTLAEMQAHVGGNVELVRLTDGRLMLVDEDGKAKALPMNPNATTLALLCGRLRPGDTISGRALVCDADQLR